MDAMDEYLEEKRRQDEEMIRNGFDDPDMRQFEPVTDAEVDAAEAKLGYKLPPSDRKLVTSTPSYEWNILNRITAKYHHEQLGAHDDERPWLIAIFGFGDGNDYCFDARHPDADGEYPIILNNHETDDKETTEYEAVAPDLGEYLLRHHVQPFDDRRSLEPPE